MALENLHTALGHEFLLKMLLLRSMWLGSVDEISRKLHMESDIADVRLFLHMIN